jgi:uncharacterized protein (DUF2252 family)
MKRKSTGDYKRWLVDKDIRTVTVEIVQAYRVAGSTQADVQRLAVFARQAIVSARLYRPTNNKNVTYWIEQAHRSAARIVMCIENHYVHRPKPDIACILINLSMARLAQQASERRYAPIYAAYRREPNMTALKAKVRLAVEATT